MNKDIAASVLRLIVGRDVEIKPGVMLAAGVYPGKAVRTRAGQTEYLVKMTVQQLARTGVYSILFSREFTITEFVQSGDIYVEPLPGRPAIRYGQGR
jgi:hypothetical protein